MREKTWGVKVLSENDDHGERNSGDSPAHNGYFVINHESPIVRFAS
jgi:hypothetical protein